MSNGLAVGVWCNTHKDAAVRVFGSLLCYSVAGFLFSLQIHIIHSSGEEMERQRWIPFYIPVILFGNLKRDYHWKNERTIQWKWNDIFECYMLRRQAMTIGGRFFVSSVNKVEVKMKSNRVEFLLCILNVCICFMIYKMLRFTHTHKKLCRWCINLYAKLKLA